MKPVLKIGLAGLGHIGKRHLSHIRAMGLVAVTADPKVNHAEAEALGSSAHYGSFEEMLAAQQPDAVVICLPSHMHRDSTAMALQSGAHVLVEKPFALTGEDAAAMLAQAEACGRRVMAAHVCRFMGQYIMAKETITGGNLGRPLFLNAWRNVATPQWSQSNWLGNKSASGGTVMDLQIHEIDLARWFLGPVRDAVLVQRQGSAQAGSGFFHTVSCLSFEDGAAAVVEAGHLMPLGYVPTNGYRLVLEGGTLEFTQRGNDPAMFLTENGKAADITDQFKARWSGRNAFRDEMEHFIGCLNTGVAFGITGEDARCAVDTVNQLQSNEILSHK